MEVMLDYMISKYRVLIFEGLYGLWLDFCLIKFN